ncbi:hypothetical protein CLLI_26030 [Clostridium liquoris]|jgi:hypothetical protein|uniref:Uncharacterized protein n=1 Tax=Clostridium liquoris TaxID=1289519 RepID=A0A2T0B0K5_9CLOT|nr:hypothetical protein [Clostridium liquoris]PRR77085.1 hypothetical protein CLLI_26030 [Clostridium liquoris]
MGTNKVDKGFELFYWRLSYKRKFIRTLWMIPIDIIVSVFLILKGDTLFINRVIPILLIILGGIQLIYNYLKWKKDENNAN